jgi:hypothetical protein
MSREALLMLLRHCSRRARVSRANLKLSGQILNFLFADNPKTLPSSCNLIFACVNYFCPRIEGVKVIPTVILPVR